LLVGNWVDVRRLLLNVYVPDTLKEVVESPWKEAEEDDKTGSARVAVPETTSVPPTVKFITAKFDDILYIYMYCYM
jgi:hypothetical protein